MGGVDGLTMSYLRLRQAIGWLGVSLPFLLLAGGWMFKGRGPQPSISEYYYTPMRDVFVGAHFAFGVFLGSYRVVMISDRSFDDDRWPGILACVFAIGLALFPTDPPGAAQVSAIAWIHYFCAACWLLTLAYFAYFLFPRSAPGATPTAMKRERNKIYRRCGIVMIAMIGLMFLYAAPPAAAKAPLAGLAPVFWLQTIAVLAFGCAWLVKGELILKDTQAS